MSTILSLPVELLTKIAKLVPQPIHLTLVCRLLNDVATPVAYRTLTLPPLHLRSYWTPEAIARVLGHLLRTLMAQPSIGMHVRHLDVSFDNVPMHNQEATKISEDIRIPALEAAASHGLGDRVHGQLQDGLLSAAFFLLLCYFPNLDSLVFVPQFRGTFFSHIASSKILPCGLQSLRSVYIHQSYVNDDTERKDIFTVFGLPSLRILRWDIDESFYYRRNTQFDGMSRIQDISIKSTHVDAWVLAEMVRSVQRLRSFRYDQGDGFWYQPFFGDLFGGGLQAHAHTLEHLDIQIVDDDEKRHRPVGSLRKYTKLTRLAVAMPLLLGNPDLDPIVDLQHPRRIGELLPEALVKFEVYVNRDWKHTACGHLMRLIEVDLQQVPNLKLLSLYGANVISESDATMLRAACIASGINLHI